MFYLLWMILNIVLFVFFIVTCFRATKLIREKLGLFTAVIFVFGLLSFMGRPNDANKSANEKNKWYWEQDKKADSLAYHFQKFEKIVLQKNMMFSINLGFAKYIKDDTKEVVPLTAYTTATGTFGGYKWVPEFISITKAEDGRNFQYNVSGKIEMSLLGMTISTQYKNYAGIIEIQ